MAAPLPSRSSPPAAAVVAVDAGTTGVRAMAVSEAGDPVAYAYRALRQHYPRPGWVEHDPEEIFDAVCGALSALAAEVSGPVAAIGLTNQRETVVAWDARTGAPRHRAIVWQDRRTAGRCQALREAGHEPAVRAATGLVLDPYFSATKAAWLVSEGGVAADAHLRLGTVDSWLLWKLTGGAVFATDPSNASRTSLYDLGAGRWSEELCDLFGVPVAALAEIRPSCARFGPAETPLGAVAVSGIAGDQQAALLGQACFEPGLAKATYGTGSFVLLQLGPHRPPPADGLLTTVAWDLGDGAPAYALEGSIFATGATVGWLRDGLGVIEHDADLEPLARSVRSSEGVHVVPAFAGLGSPWWDPWARGTVVGLTRGLGRAHLARAVVDAMAFQTRDVVDAMVAASGRPLGGLRADGGAAVMDLLLQLQADQLQVPVTRPRHGETTALGAAWLAGLGSGVWSSPAEVAGLWRAGAEFPPRARASAADSRHAEWRRALERARGWARPPEAP